MLQEVKRKERAEKERVAAQNEFLNRSLRGSKKLQALESGSTGVDNDAFTQDEPPVPQIPDTGVAGESDDVFADTLHKVISEYAVGCLSLRYVYGKICVAMWMYWN